MTQPTLELGNRVRRRHAILLAALYEHPQTIYLSTEAIEFGPSSSELIARLIQFSGPFRGLVPFAFYTFCMKLQILIDLCCAAELVLLRIELLPEPLGIPYLLQSSSQLTLEKIGVATQIPVGVLRALELCLLGIQLMTEPFSPPRELLSFISLSSQFLDPVLKFPLSSNAL